MSNKQPYTAPELQDLGSVADLTRHGQTAGDGDTFFKTGSVYPGGHQ